MANSLLMIILVASTTIFTRTIIDEGIVMIKELEGFRATFYRDQAGIMTIGYGHACHVHDCSTIHPPITEAQGERLLRQDLIPVEDCVDNSTPGLDDNKFAALVSFTFNVGCSKFKASTLARYVRERDFAAAANEFPKWVYAGGKYSPGLAKRRARERAFFCSSGGC